LTKFWFIRRIRATQLIISQSNSLVKKTVHSFVALLTGVSLWLGELSANAAGDGISLAGLGNGVNVTFGQHDIPHVYAKSWPDAARVLGYLHAG
jgi:acyl-homoserine lactone acylase PvdQ